jgi:hypothetical protein
MSRIHLCKFARDILDAEERRVALQKELTQAEADLDEAFTELFEHYIKHPHPVRFEEAEMAKVAEICSAWVSHSRRSRPAVSKGLFKESA